MLPYDDPWTYSCIKLVPYHTSRNKRYVINEIENHEQYIHQVHHVPKCAHHAQHPCTSTMCQKISSMKCIHHMPTCASTNMPTCASANMPNNVQIPSMSVPSYIITCTKQVYQPCVNKLRFPNDVHNDYQSTCLNV